GFLPRGLSYACRRPKLFTEADGRLSAVKVVEADIQDLGEHRRDLTHSVIPRAFRRLQSGHSAKPALMT
ncbi:hypothetical protein, partial [Mesorhizobium sp.]|uniref:hypothetical protein n=1 Tax=Mesorhizobium sp. TaxID=1871066 RepID=UPI0025DC904B